MFFLPFNDFTTPATPLDVEQYTEYRQHSIDWGGSVETTLRGPYRARAAAVGY
jgi:hypothetical protein